jgi:hypothetical protein
MSPDGQRIAYWYRSGTREGVAIMDANGVGERPVIDYRWPTPPAAPGTFTVPRRTFPALAWRSADEIVFVADALPGSGTAMVTVDLRSGESRTTPFSDGMVQSYAVQRGEMIYAPAGGSISSPYTRPLRARRLIDGAERIVATSRQRVTEVVASPDGRQVAYASADAATLARMSEFETLDDRSPRLLRALGTFLSSKITSELYVEGVEGDTPSPSIVARDTGAFADSLVPLSFSPDGRFLLYRALDKSLRVVSTRGGDSWPLIDKQQPAQTPEWLDAHWAADGSVLLTGAHTQTELRMWDGVTYDAVVRLIERPLR